MKHLFNVLAFVCLISIITGCTAETTSEELVETQSQTELNSLLDPCLDADPITRVINNGTDPFSLEVWNSNGDVIVAIFDIPANTTTSWASFTEGEVMFSVTNASGLISDDKVVLQMDTCMAYEIEIDSNNAIVSYIPTIL